MSAAWLALPIGTASIEKPSCMTCSGELLNGWIARLLPWKCCASIEPATSRQRTIRSTAIVRVQPYLPPTQEGYTGLACELTFAGRMRHIDKLERTHQVERRHFGTGTSSDFGYANLIYHERGLCSPSERCSEGASCLPVRGICFVGVTAAALRLDVSGR